MLPMIYHIIKQYTVVLYSASQYGQKEYYLGDNCIVFGNFTASIGDLMVANCVYWRHVSRVSKRIFATIKSTIDAMKFLNTIQL